MMFNLCRKLINPLNNISTLGVLQTRYAHHRPTKMDNNPSPYTRQVKRFVARTVMVQDNNVVDAIKVLNRILDNEGVIKRFRLTRRYEKRPYQISRLRNEVTKAIYDEDQKNRIDFILRKHRPNPYPGTGF